MAGILPQPGDFCCVPISGTGGWLIRLGEELNGSKFTQYQHAEIYVGSAAGVMTPAGAGPLSRLADVTAPFGYTMGAYPGGARLVPLACPPEKIPGALWSSGAIELTSRQRDDIVRVALARRGTRYSALDYFALATHRLGIPAPGLREFIAATGHQICSQQVDWVYERAGVHLFSDGRWPGYVTPADLASWIEDHILQRVVN